MGSYAGITDTKTDKFVYANHKFFGYISDEEIKKSRAYKYLLNLNPEIEYLINITYIGTIMELSPEETKTFMMLYARDYGCTFFNMWSVKITDVHFDNSCFLSFD